MTHIPQDQIQQLIEWAIELQQIPAPTFSETDRAAHLLSLFHQVGASDVELDECGNVWTRIPGGDKKPVMVTAHLDSVHPLKQSLLIKRSNSQVTGPGIGDNALGLAALVELARFHIKAGIKLPGDLILVATVGEEGLGNLKGMQKVLEKLGGIPHCTIVLEGIGLGQIQQRALGALRYRIQVKTVGGHSWSDYGNPSAIHELVKLATEIQSIPLPSSPRTTMNIGVIRGGTAINAIAQTACMELDLRSEDAQVLMDVASQIKKLVVFLQQTGVETTLEEIGSRPAGSIPSFDPFLHLARKTLLNLGINPRMIISSTDASLLIQKHYPVISIGLTTGSGVHTVDETIDIQPLSTGLKQLYTIVSEVWSVAP